MAQPNKDRNEATTRRGRAGPVGADARAAGAAAFSRAGFADASFVLHWDTIVGPELARLVRPLRLSAGPEGGTLSLRAQPGAALFLQHESRRLIERINSYLGREAVARLRFVEGTLKTRPTHIVKKRAPGPVRADDPATAFKGPESVRTALLNLARWQSR